MPKHLLLRQVLHQQRSMLKHYQQQPLPRCQVGVGDVARRVERLLAKLGRRDRTQLVVFAYESGLLTPAVRSTTRG